MLRVLVVSAMKCLYLFVDTSMLLRGKHYISKSNQIKLILWKCPHKGLHFDDFESFWEVFENFVGWVSVVNEDFPATKQALLYFFVLCLFAAFCLYGFTDVNTYNCESQDPSHICRVFTTQLGKSAIIKKKHFKS